MAKKRKKKSSGKVWSIFTNDMTHCFITGAPYPQKHHIFGTTVNKPKSEKYGFMLPLRHDWHNMKPYSIHMDRELNLKYKRACQDYWLEHYGTKEDFIKEFGKWW